MRVRNAQSCIFMLVWFLSMTLLGCGGGGGGGNPAGPASSVPGEITVGSSIPVIEQTVSPSGGTIVIASSASPLNGMSIRIPAGAYSGNVEIRVSCASITGQTINSDVSAVSPMIFIDAEGQRAGSGVYVSFPVTLDSTDIPIAVLYDTVSGAMETVPISSFDQHSITVGLKEFSGQAPAASIRPAAMRAGLSTLDRWGMVLLRIPLALLPSDIGSAFRPGIHTWKNINWGSVLAPGGHCAGAALSAQWCFYQGITPPVYGRFDSNATKEIWQDDVVPIRFNSMVQNDVDWASDYRSTIASYSEISDRVTFDLFRANMYFSGKPQYIEMWKGALGHALTVYKISGNTLYIADPNYPTDERKLELVGGAFQTFPASLVRDGENIQFDTFHYVGAWGMLDVSKMKQRWAEVLAGSVGVGVFPPCELFARNKAGNFVALADGFVASGTSIQVALKRNGAFDLNCNLPYFSKESGNCSYTADLDYTTWPDRMVYRIPLKSGENILGLEMDLVPAGTVGSWSRTFWNNAVWGDFKWVKVYALASPTNVVATAGTGTVKLSWDAVPGADSYNVYWSASQPPSVTSGTKIQGVASCTYTHTGLTVGTAYHYVVTAFNTHLESAESAAVIATPTTGPGAVPLKFAPQAIQHFFDGKFSVSGSGVFKGPGAVLATVTQNTNFYGSYESQSVLVDDVASVALELSYQPVMAITGPTTWASATTDPAHPTYHNYVQYTVATCSFTLKKFSSPVTTRTGLTASFTYSDMINATTRDNAARVGAYLYLTVEYAVTVKAEQYVNDVLIFTSETSAGNPLLQLWVRPSGK